MEELLEMEASILSSINFDLSFASFSNFYNRYSIFNSQSARQHSM